MKVFLVHLCTDTTDAGTYHIGSAWFSQEKAEAALNEYNPEDRYDRGLKRDSYVSEIEVRDSEPWEAKFWDLPASLPPANMAASIAAQIEGGGYGRED